MNTGLPQQLSTSSHLPAADRSADIVDPAAKFAAALADPNEAALSAVLQEVFGHTAFRSLQLPTVQRLLAGESLLSIMPTGMGKSLCYQLPAAVLPGLTLVVSPLIALMHDQAASMPKQVRAWDKGCFRTFCSP
jgi:superfamily II DNA helicase RecQ